MNEKTEQISISPTPWRVSDAHGLCIVDAEGNMVVDGSLGTRIEAARYNASGAAEPDDWHAKREDLEEIVRRMNEQPSVDGITALHKLIGVVESLTTQMDSFQQTLRPLMNLVEIDQGGDVEMPSLDDCPPVVPGETSPKTKERSDINMLQRNTLREQLVDLANVAEAVACLTVAHAKPAPAEPERPSVDELRMARKKATALSDELRRIARSL